MCVPHRRQNCSSMRRAARDSLVHLRLGRRPSAQRASEGAPVVFAVLGRRTRLSVWACTRRLAQVSANDDSDDDDDDDGPSNNSGGAPFNSFGGARATCVHRAQASQLGKQVAATWQRRRTFGGAIFSARRPNANLAPLGSESCGRNFAKTAGAACLFERASQQSSLAAAVAASEHSPGAARVLICGRAPQPPLGAARAPRGGPRQGRASQRAR